MTRSARIDYEREPSPAIARAWDDDPRWALTQRVIAGRHFIRSPLLSKLLLDVVTESLGGRQDEITEHKLGVRVFRRPLDYRTVDDNIVRNYARQLRKRLAEYFAEDGSREALRIHIPVGGYVPVFTRADEMVAAAVDSPMLVQTHAQQRPAKAAHKWPVWVVFLIAYSALLMGLTWFIAGRVHASKPVHDEARPLWTALFHGAGNCYIVPSDAGLNLIEDLSHRPMTLADYVQGKYLDLPIARVDAHSAEDLRTQHFASFVDVEIAAGLARRPEFDPQRVTLRFPRDVRLDDLKSGNAVLLGSVGSNPWAAVPPGANFKIESGTAMSGAMIINQKPEAGEWPAYASRWNEPAHETFALILFLPNLSGNGHLLLLQGLDAAGTQAAAETLFHPEAIADVLHKATRPDGSMRPFEILLRCTSLQANAMNTTILGSRIH